MFYQQKLVEKRDKWSKVAWDAVTVLKASLSKIAQAIAPSRAGEMNNEYSIMKAYQIRKCHRPEQEYGQWNHVEV